MKKIVLFFILIFAVSLHSQTDFSNNWEDFYSYNNVKDFIKVDNFIYAMADNAVFIYNTDTEETQKLSSVQGLSGETTSAIHYNKTFDRLIIGYENGLVEVVDADGEITVSADIVGFNISGSKSINHIYEYNDKLYLSTDFAVVEYNIERVEFGDTFFIGQNSSEIKVNEIAVLNDIIYAATENGFYTADVNNPNLIDFNNWQAFSLSTNFNHIAVFNNQIYSVSNTNLLRIESNNSTSLVRNFNENIFGLKTSNTNLSVALNQYAVIYNSSLTEVAQIDNVADFNFTLNTSFTEDNIVYLGTKEFGVLITNLNNISTFQEVHPDGPLSNDPFFIAVKNDNLWVVYGGYNATFTPNLSRRGYSHLKEGAWINKRYDPTFPVTDLNYISIDPIDNNHVFISSMGSTTNINSVSTGGLMEIIDDEIVNFYNQNNSPLEDIIANVPNAATVRIVGTVFDDENNLWVTNIFVEERLKKLSPSGQWSGVNINDIITRREGIGEIVIDKTNTIWIASRQNGVLAYNKITNQKRALTTEINKGSLPNALVKTVAVDASNKLWIGTREGLVVYNNAAGFFDADIYDAEPIIILDDGIPKKLLGDQTVNTIVVDGADNKWFGTENAGVLYTNPNGQNTIANFNKSNSPLPSNKIQKIAVDDSTGKVYFATDKGIVVYNSNVSPFGEELGEVYAYPNPALKNHETITITGQEGSNLPKGTNVKILDVAGNLVYETNVVEGQELQGGKVVWDKRNLAGNKVASGIYIALLSNDDDSESTTTKIAIVN